MTHPLQGTLENRDGAWVLTLIRDFAHPAERVWPWLTDPDRLRRWSPIVPDQPFDGAGTRLVRENPGDDPVAGDVISCRSTARTGASLGRRRRALAAHSDRYRLPAHAGADHARPGPRRDERSRLASVPRRARRRAERRCDVSSRREGRTRPRVGGLTRRLRRTARRLVTAAGRRERRPRCCCRPGHARTRRSTRGDTPATAAARATTRHRSRPRRRRRP